MASIPFELRGKTVYVAGHRGMVGSALVRRLAQENIELLTVGRREVDLRDQAAVFTISTDDVLTDSSWSVTPVEAGGLEVVGSSFADRISAVQAGGGIAGLGRRVQKAPRIACQ